MEVFKIAKERGANIAEIEKEIDSIHEQIKSLKLQLLGAKTKPPAGY